MNSADDSSWQAEIVAVEERANAAFLNRDLDQLEHLFSDELVVNSPINRVNDKKKLLELLGSGAIGHVSSTIRHELMRRDGDLVVVMGSDAVQDAGGGKSTLARGWPSSRGSRSMSWT